MTAYKIFLDTAIIIGSIFISGIGGILVGAGLTIITATVKTWGN